MSALLSVAIQYEIDVVAARQRARQIAELLGFNPIEQTRIATAVSEVARNAFMYAGGGRVEYALEGSTPPQILTVRVVDQGPGISNLDAILAGEYQSSTGLGLGLVGARRLMDRCEIDTSPTGTYITLAKLLPPRSRLYEGPALGRVAERLAQSGMDAHPYGEIQAQNRELVRALDALRARQEELERVNRELEDTNRGVVALYAELDERADHLRRADEVKTKFLSNMTHEFRTPVNSILALSRLLGERLEIDEHEKGELFYIRKSAQQLSDLVDDLLDIAKVEAGKIDIRPGHFEVAGLFGALRGMLRPLLVGQSLSLVFEEAAGLPPLYSDETKISQILRNFISNALKYTEHGEVRVSASVRAGEDAIDFTVSDTGIGIPEADLPRIFDEFVQIENPLQRRVKGTGLGLPLSKRLAELLGGRITVSSTLGQGSTFVLTVPLVCRTPAALVVPAMPAALPGQIPVLLVEDSDEDALTYHRLLASSPYQILHARSVREAEQMLAATRPAAVILDIRLHGLESWDFLVRLRHDPATSEVPVIVAATVDDRRKAFGLGATAFGLKPVERSWLIRTLETVVQHEAILRVLTIDDEEACRFIIRESLPSRQFRVIEAATGREGLEAARAARPDVALIDMQLPDMSGYDVIRALAGDEATASIPIVVVTAQAVTLADVEQIRPGARLLPKAALSREALRSAIRDVVWVSPAPVRGT
jgi:signal transduction histidine kinase/CheY-like chemotaxis protein